MLRLRATWMRGGTSKCWLFDGGALEAAGAEPDRVLAAAFGAADPRQLDGVGGATSTTSKAAIVHRSTEPGIDVDYAFAQVGIGVDRVEWGSNCGNCATAIGLYALQSGLVPARHPRTTVRMRNLNTGALMATSVPTPGGTVPETGEATVPGVESGGVPVELAFLRPAGTTTGALLPTGRAVDWLELPDGSRAEAGAGPGTGASVGAAATLVDAGAPAALLAAADLGLDPACGLEEVAARLPELTRLRRAAALAMGLARPEDPVSHAVPKVGVVGPAADYRTTDGRSVSARDHDLAVRMVSMHAPHPAIGLTSAVAVAAAAALPGSTAALALGADGERSAGGASDAGSGRRAGRRAALRLGTPAGVVEVRAEADPDGRLSSVSISRAARRLAVAELFVPLPDSRRLAARDVRPAQPA
ncbi:PrpF domain-containing protein [Phaeacidiphilus oryzae]|uniref:PrpF domain-containing protein n=1 Tax=Phaeacidiphilus oryzae TaxID=348818 RepID=UPI00068C0AAB|nr:PrpF domain-containing protein [Phaeacidiphilus oryzae]